MNTGNLEAWQLALVVVFTIHLVQSGFWRGKARHKDGAILFGATPLFRLLGALGTFLYAWGFIDQSIELIHGAARSGFYLVLFAAMMFLTASAWPRTITLEDSSIHKRRIFKRPLVIEYSKVASITYDLKRKETTVYGEAGEAIIHSNLHVDRALFQEEMITRTRKKLELIRS